LRSYVDAGIIEKVRDAGGELFAITSEPQYLASQANEHWELNFENIGDPHQEISRTCSERGWLTLYANRGSLDFLQGGTDWEVEHPKGYFQPGVIALTNEGRILYRWRSIPSVNNLNGTVARPSAGYVWSSIQQSISGETTSEDAPLDEDPEIDQGPPPRPLFFGALIANGWFLKLKSFAYSPGVEPVPIRFKKALSRWWLFGASWIIAFALVPVLPVSLALLCWVGWIGYQIKKTTMNLDNQVALVASSGTNR
jgi:hypothetical protein